MESRHFLSMLDLDGEEIARVLDFAGQLKARSLAGDRPPLLQGRTLGMIFQKPSLRTLVSFDVAMRQLGGHALFLGPDMISLGKREPARDIARVLSSMVDVISARVFSHNLLVELAAHSRRPVINALSDHEHPCQALADLLTIREARRRLEGLRLAFIGDGNNVANSLVFAGARVGMSVTVASPKGYELDPEVLAAARTAAQATGARIEQVRDPREAASGADVLYTDVWASMGQESETEARKAAFAGYRIDEALIARAAPEVVVLHCLPAHYGDEITEGAVEHVRSRVFEQAENRLHAQKALLALIVR